MIEWRDCILGDLVTFQRGHDLPKSKMNGGKYPVVGSNGIIGHHDKYTTEAPSITVGRSGNVGKPFIYYGKSWSHNTSLYIKDFKGNDPIFIYYFLQTLDLENYAGGSAVPTLNRNHVHSLNVSVPREVNVQKKIGESLKLIDDKINTNEKINKNLLEQAQAIYTKMFITDADSLWPEGKLSDLIEVCYGKDHKKLHDGDIPVYGSGGIMRHVDRALYEQESVLVPRKGTLNNVMYVNEPFWSVDTMFFTKMKRQNVAKFVFHFLKGKDLASMNAGSAVPSMTTKILNAIPLQIPDDQMLSTFEAQVSPFYQTASYNNKESENLAAIRDSLLPKLMSGEIDVSDIDL